MPITSPTGMRVSSGLLSGLLLLLLNPQGVASQVVAGQVVDAEDARPLDVAFVALLDDTGQRRASGLTDAGGAFRLRAPAPGRYRVRVEHIGYEDVESQVLDVPEDGVVQISLAASVRAIELAGITVGGERRCTVRPAEGELTAQLWDEARKTLTMAAWAQDARILRFRVVEWRRVLDPTTLRILEEESRPRIGFHGGSPFISLPVGELQEGGYIQRLEDGALQYYAPDPAVLLSDDFLDAHCFLVRLDDPPEEGWVGLAFEPVHRGDVPDIEGVLWLDAATFELERVEYRYTRLPAGLRTDRVGGTVEFDRIPEGPWIVSRWAIRTPGIGVRARRTPGGVRRVQEPLLTGLNETGGRVVAVRAPDASPLFGRIPGAERLPREPELAPGELEEGATDLVARVATYLTVRDVETREVVPDVSFRLDDGSWRTTGARGRIHLGAVAPGPHRLELRHISFGVWSDTLVVPGSGPHHWIVDLVPRAIELDGITVTVDAVSEAERSLRMSGIDPAALGRRWITLADIEAINVKRDVGTILEWRGINGMRVVRPENLVPGSENMGLCVSLVRARTGTGANRCALVVIDGRRRDPIQALYLDPETIAAVAVLQPIEATILFGVPGEAGAVMFWTRK